MTCPTLLTIGWCYMRCGRVQEILRWSPRWGGHRSQEIICSRNVKIIRLGVTRIPKFGALHVCRHALLPSKIGLKLTQINVSSFSVMDWRRIRVVAAGRSYAYIMVYPHSLLTFLHFAHDFWKSSWVPLNRKLREQQQRDSQALH